MEKRRRANAGFVRAKQLGIWTAALAFSYLDLVTTVVVGREYLGMGTREGTRAAHVTFGMVGASLGLQTLLTHLTGEPVVSQSRASPPPSLSPLPIIPDPNPHLHPQPHPNPPP